MACEVRRNENNEIASVLAPNGKPSILYREINNLVPEKEVALNVWLQAYTAEFAAAYGDWRTFLPGNDQALKLDENGEPALMYMRLPGIAYRDTEQTQLKIRNFLSKLGVKIEYVQDLLPDDVSAQADFMNRVIHITESQQKPDTLPEEAAHFFVRLLPADSSLRKKMFDSIVSYPIYKQVLNQYATTYTKDGKVDFEKIKEEAIAKLIAAVIVNPETVHSQSSKVVQAQNWYEQLFHYIKRLFSQNRLEPFIQASDAILQSKTEFLDLERTEADSDIMYQLSSSLPQDRVVERLRSNDKALIKKIGTQKDPETGKYRESYFYKGREVKNRVTDAVKKYYSKVFPNKSSSQQREYFNFLAEQGTAIHQDIESAIKRHLSDDGKLSPNKNALSASIKTSEKVFSTIDKSVLAFLTNIQDKYGKETVFMPELKIYDEETDTAGTIDLLIIKPNGRVDIVDWKSMEINIKAFTEIPGYKQNAYTIQFDSYEKIVNKVGAEIDLKRAVPVRTVMGKDESTGKYTELTGVEMGEKFILPDTTPSYLMPVPSRTEKTLTSADDLIAKLQAMEERLNNQKVIGNEKFAKQEELRNIRKAVSSLQLNHSFQSTIQVGNILIGKIERLLNMTDSDTAKAQSYYQQVQVYTDLARTIDILESENFISAITDEEKSAVYELSGKASRFEEKLKKYLIDRGNEIAEKVGVSDIETIEKNPSWWAANIRSISGTATNAVKVFYNYLKRFQDAVYRSRDETNEKLFDLRKELLTWATENNIPAEKVFDSILEFDAAGRWKGTFLNKYTSDFWEKKEKYIKDKNTDGLIEILDLSDASREKFETRKKSFLQWADSNIFSQDQAQDQKIREKRIEDWNYRYNVFDSKYQSIALLNPNNYVTGNQTYFSEKWKNLQQQPTLLKTYNYFQSLLQKAESLGIVDNNGRFIPNIANSKIEMWAQYGASSIFNLPGFFNEYEYKSGSTWGEVDPITGKPLQTVPRLFLNDLSVLKTGTNGETYKDYSLKSKDLFTVFSVWGKYIAEYEYNLQLQDIGNLLLTTESIKDRHLHRQSDGKFVPVKGNADNIAYLEDYMNYYVFGRKLKDNNPWEFELFGKHYSGKQIVQGGIRYMGMKTLAFNTLSIAANYIGGKFNTYFSATKGQFFNKKQWASGEMALSSDKGKALVNYFDVFLEDSSFHKSKQLSVYGAVKHLSYDNMFIGQRLTDKAVQYPVLLAMCQSYGVVDGKIVNLKDYIKKKNNFNITDQLSKQQQKDRIKQIEQETALLEKTNSIWALSEIKDGKIVIPGITRDLETVMEFRQAVKRANKIILGNSTSDDISRYRMSLLGQALGQFRNWMPAMIDERFSDLYYNSDSASWTKGKILSYFNNYFSANTEESKNQQVFQILTKHLGVLVKDLIGLTSTNNMIERAKILFVKEKADAQEKGLPFPISLEDYTEMHLRNVQSTLSEIRLILSFTALIVAMAGAAPDKDDKNKGITRFVTRALDKFSNELLFYYNPINFTNLINSPIPVVGLATDAFKFVGHLSGEIYGQVQGDEDLIKKYKPTKYIFKDIPISREIYTLGTIFSEDMRKTYQVTN